MAGLDKDQAARYAKALQANAEQLFQIIQDTDTETLKIALRNPQLGDDHLLALLKRRDLQDEIPKLIHQLRQNELSHSLRLALVKNPATPGALVRSLLPHLRLFELVDLCFIPGVTGDQRVSAERAILLRLQTTPVGNKITLARRATATVVGELLKEGDSRTMDACLNSPRLKEAAVFQFLNGANASATTISMIARNKRWSQRPNLRLAILKNRNTPDIWYTLWIPRLNTAAVNNLLASQRLSPRQKTHIQQLINRRSRS